MIRMNRHSEISRVTLAGLITLIFLLSVSARPVSAEPADQDLPVPAATPADEPQSDETDADEPDKPKPWWKNIVPVPVIITEPAIGEGLGIGIGYFHPAKAAGTYQPKTIENASVVRDVSVARKPPPTITGAFGAVTNNGTWAGGIGHMNSFRNDTIRYLGVAAYANVITDIYILDRPFEFKLEGVFVFNDIKFRVAESNWFLGAALTYLNGNSTFRRDIPEPQGASDGFLASDFRDVGVEAQLMYESRDDTLMPSTGRLFDLSFGRNDESLGGDYNYNTLEMKFLSFHQLHPDWVLGLRAEYSAVSGDPPFYAIPWVTLRGIPALRFQGKQVVVAEAEGRYNFNQDWAAIAFYGRGWTDNRFSGNQTELDIEAWGVGARYRLLKEQNAWVGIDFARGPEEDVYYVQVGHAW